MTEKLPPVSDIPTGKYRHYKGNLYEVICVARHSETLEDMVVYRALYGEHELWTRPAAMWTEEVMSPNGPVGRFTLVE